MPGGHQPRARAAADAPGLRRRQHHCLGAPLARRELYWAFKVIVDRIDEMWFLEGENDFSYQPNYFLRALKELHIGFTPVAV